MGQNELGFDLESIYKETFVSSKGISLLKEQSRHSIRGFYGFNS